ncbi:MAG: endonuclease/exonuclease/phosphatase family protein [Desulfobacteraceae bacterium]|nr:endonuclease/exonuclease/phosphatase family protein [Desulfobacteraceae bacterium]
MKKFIKTILSIVLLGVFIFASFLVYATVADYKPEPETMMFTEQVTEKIPVNEKLDFMIWNIGYCGLSKDMDFFYDGGKNVRPTNKVLNENLSKIKTFIKKQNQIEFFLFQEVDINSKRSYGTNQYEGISELFPEYHTSFGKNYDVDFIPVPVNAPMGKVLSGLQTLSAYTPESVVRHSFPGNYSWPQGLFMLDRCFLVNKYQVKNNKNLIVINTHNSAYDDGNLRKSQMEYLKKFLTMEYEKGNYIIVGGDWNQCPPDFTPDFKENIMDTTNRMDISKDFMPDWTWLYQNKIPTNRRVDIPYYKGKTLTTVIDFFLVSPNIETMGLKAINLDFENSDHQPVKLSIVLK